MIKTDEEWTEALKRLDNQKKIIAAQLDKLKESGLSEEQISLALDPLRSFMLGLEEEVKAYERLKGG